MSSTTQNDEYDDAVEFDADGRAIDSWRHPWNLGDIADSSGEFGRNNGIYYWALPFKYYNDNSPYEAISNISKHLQGLHATRRDVSRSTLNDESKRDDTSVDGLEAIALINGWWRGGERTSGKYYCNPNYPHSFDDDELLSAEPITDEETEQRRKELARLAADLGLPSTVLVRPFDVSGPSCVTNWCLDFGISYSERRIEGMKTMARTWKTIHHWGVKYKDIANTFGLPSGTFYSRLKKVEDFEPPDEPSIPVYEDDDTVYSK